MMKKNKDLLAIFATSLAVYLCVCWINILQSIYWSSWVHSLSFMALTWFWLSKKDDNIKASYIVGVIMIGRITLEVLVRIFDFSGTVYSLMFPVASWVSILMTTLCFYKRSIGTYILSSITIILANTILQTAWERLLN